MTMFLYSIDNVFYIMTMFVYIMTMFVCNIGARPEPVPEPEPEPV